MLVLMISSGSDESIFQKESKVSRRMIAYGRLVTQLHIVVFTKRRNKDHILDTLKISDNVWIYPTNSLSKYSYILDGYRIAKEIICDKLFILHDALITCQDPFEAGIVGYFVAKKFKLSLELQVHTDFLSPYFQNSFMLNRVRVHIASFLLPKARCIRVVSERVKDALKAKYCKLKTEPFVLPVFVDVSKARAIVNSHDLHIQYPRFNFIILTAGRFTKEKNMLLAISALALVVKRYPNVGLVIVGDGPEKKKYQAHIARLHMSENIILESWIDNLDSYYKTADILLVTSDYEGYNRTVIEAQAAGLPVVMTDVGIAGEIIHHGKNGLITPVGDGGALTRSLISVIEKKVSLQTFLPEMIEKKEYLRIYKKMWKACI